jgi:hypothetical protein
MPEPVPTHEQCDECGAPEYFVPGYLTHSLPGRGKAYTVARQIEHEATCPRVNEQSEHN